MNHQGNFEDFIAASFLERKNIKLPNGHKKFWEVTSSFDDDEGKQLFVMLHYRTDMEVPEEVKMIRGVIVNVQEKKIVSWGYGHSEVVEVKNNSIPDVVYNPRDESKENIGSSKVFYRPGMPGIMFQVFRHNGRLHVCSYRRFNVLEQNVRSHKHTYGSVVRRLTKRDPIVVFNSLFDEEAEAEGESEAVTHHVHLVCKEFMTFGPFFEEGLYYIGSYDWDWNQKFRQKFFDIRPQGNYKQFFADKPIFTKELAENYIRGKGTPDPGVPIGGMAVRSRSQFESEILINPKGFVTPGSFIIAEVHKELSNKEWKVQIPYMVYEIWTKDARDAERIMTKGSDPYRAFFELVMIEWRRVKQSQSIVHRYNIAVNDALQGISFYSNVNYMKEIKHYRERLYQEIQLVNNFRNLLAEKPEQVETHLSQFPDYLRERIMSRRTIETYEKMIKSNKPTLLFLMSGYTPSSYKLVTSAFKYFTSYDKDEDTMNPPREITLTNPVSPAEKA